jgi:hypothetical protein
MDSPPRRIGHWSLVNSQWSLGKMMKIPLPQRGAWAARPCLFTHARRPYVRPFGPRHPLNESLTLCRLAAHRSSSMSLRSCPKRLQAFAVFHGSCFLLSCIFQRCGFGVVLYKDASKCRAWGPSLQKERCPRRGKVNISRFSALLV